MQFLVYISNDVGEDEKNKEMECFDTLADALFFIARVVDKGEWSRVTLNKFVENEGGHWSHERVLKLWA